MAEELSAGAGEGEQRVNSLQAALSAKSKLRLQLRAANERALAAGLSMVQGTQAQRLLSLVSSFVPQDVVGDDRHALDMLLLLPRIVSKERLLRLHLSPEPCTSRPPCVCLGLALFVSSCLVLPRLT